MSMKPPSIDLVYTWVKGEDPDYQTLYNRYAGTRSDRNPERYRDNLHLLRYSLRSVARYAPWLRRIYLFTCRPQMPEWMNDAHPGLRVVHHDEIIDPKYLPTFSCNTIESYLHRIPDVSDYFLYMNDDFLLGRAVEPEDFLTGDGRIRVFGSVAGERLPFRIYDGKYDLISLGPIEHAPMLVYGPFYEAMLELYPEALEKTRLNRFRQPADLRMDKLYRYFLLSRRRKDVQPVPAWELLRYHRFHKVTTDFERQRKKLEKLRRMKPKFYCLNDDQGSHPNPAVVALAWDFLEQYYPEPSPFEK